MVLCIVVSCSSKSGKHKGLGFFTNQGEEQEELTNKRRNEWISAVSRSNAINKTVLERERVCREHFVFWESQHQIRINFISIGFQLSPFERRNM